MLEARSLSVTITGAHAVRDANLSIAPGERVGIVGESGCGKSMLALSLMGMTPESAAVSGSLMLDGREMVGASQAQWRRHRGRDVAMIFQEPLAALNPLMRIGNIVAEPLIVHAGIGRRAARDRAVSLLDEVGIADPRARLPQFPHELSGGQRQRVLIALALAMNPRLLIADEPTTALDVRVAARIIDLLAGLSERRGMALVFISHDLGAVARATRRIAVMYGGDIVESGPTEEVLAAPLHPYTRGLLGARPAIEPGRERRRRLAMIPGTVPPLGRRAPGCPFSGRCAVEEPRCADERPAAIDAGAGRLVACHAVAAGPAGGLRSARTGLEARVS